MAAAIKEVKDIKQVKNVIRKRIDSRTEALAYIESTSMDSSPESLKLKREEEASKIRAVIQEQKDLLEIINMLFP